MKNSGYSFSFPKLPDGNSIERLSFDDFFDMGSGHVTLPSFPPKRLSEIIRLVNEGRSAEISIFEWLDVIEDQMQWDALSESENLEACIAAWRTIGTNHVLGDIALFKAALFIDGRASSIVSNLVETMATARKAQGLDELVAMKIDWLLALQQQNFEQLAKYCYRHQMSVAESTKYLRLPQAISYGARVNRHLFSCIADGHLNAQDDVWLSRNFLSLKTTKQQLDFCEFFIVKQNQFNYGELCGELIQSFCLPMKDGSFWNTLSIESKQILKKKFNLSNYFDLKAISSALYSEHAAEELGLSDDETRQIRSRSMFWSNYSSRFERVRVLLPKSSFHFVAQHNNGLPDFVDDIDESGLLETEIYIFEIGKLIAVEFLRGVLSETRFFKNDAWYAQRLFESKALTTSDIRALSQLEVHDHLPSWQYFCEKLLRTKFGIFPNDNIPYFKGLPPGVNEYQKERGLIVVPNQEMLEQRRSKLESWVERFWASEVETGKFGRLSGLKQKSNLYLSKALMAKQLGNQDEYDLYIKKAANQGNPEAMWQLGLSMIKQGHGNRQRVLDGENWIRQASAQGHKEAINAAERYRLK